MSYSLDPTGKSLRNKVIGETKAVALLPGRTHLFMIMKDGPFYTEGLFIKYTPHTGQPRILVPGIDYVAAFPFVEATRKINAPIFAGVEFMDLTMSGTVTCTYQALGGDYGGGAATISGIETGFIGDPRFAKWETLLTLPAVPTITHPWTVANVDDVANAVTELEKVGLVVHLRPRFLPSPDQAKFIPTPEELGLGNLPNYPVATDQQALIGLETQALMTPATTKIAAGAEVTRVLSDSGYLVPIPHAGGLYIVNPKTTVEYQDRVYAIRPSAVPYTTTGVWDIDKTKFSTVRGSDKENWVRTRIIVTGNEEEIIGLGKVFDVAVDHDCLILPQLIVNDINFMVYGVDYKLSDDKLYVAYPIGAGDKLILHTKRSFINLNRENQVNKVFVVTTPNNVFDITDKNINSENIRVTINDFIILDADAGDYQVENGLLTINYIIGIGDVIEVENIDSMPMLGKMLMRTIMYS